MDDQTVEFLEICKKCDEFFKTVIEEAVKNQNVQISEEAVFYLIATVSGAIKSSDEPDNRTLAERFVVALQGYSVRNRATEFRNLGDLSLLIAGIWWQSLLRKLVDIDYFIEIGQRSYQKASENSLNNTSELFEELSDNFKDLVNVLIEATRCISEAKMTNSDILRMYETWLRTHNGFLENKLRSLGINPIDIGTTKQ